MALPAMSAEYTSPEVPATRGLHTWSSWGILGNQECRHRSDDQPHTLRLRSSRVRRFLGSRRSGHHRSCHVRLAAGSARCGSAAFHVAPSTVFPDSGLRIRCSRVGTGLTSDITRASFSSSSGSALHSKPVPGGSPLPSTRDGLAQRRGRAGFDGGTFRQTH